MRSGAVDYSRPLRESLRREGLAYFGRTVAGQSHELTNVLNVINELAGLQLDLLQAAARGSAVRLERLAEIAGKIQHQVERGESIVRCVNRFAHSVDLELAFVEPRELLSSVAALAERPARLARTELVADFPADCAALENDPFRLQHAVATLVDLALLASSVRRQVTVRYRLSSDGAEVEVVSADPLAEPDPHLLALADLLARDLGGSFLTVRGEEGTDDRLVLRLPFHPPHEEPGAGADESAPEGGDHGV
jgi:hypothetical protein